MDDKRHSRQHALSLPREFEDSFWARLLGVRRLKFGLPLAITLAYVLIGSLWIVVSDQFILQIARMPETLASLQTYKGWFFIAFTGLLLFAMLTVAYRHVIKGHETATEMLDHLDLALTAAHGGVWDYDRQSQTLHLSPHLKSLVGIAPEEAITNEEWQARIHPDDLETVQQEIRRFIDSSDQKMRMRYRVRHSDGHYLWLDVMAHAVRNEQGEPIRLIGVAIDITAVKTAEKRIEQLAYYDTLTGLPNRAMFRRQLADQLERSLTGQEPVLVARLDLDRFMEVNSELGSDRGDEILMKIGERLRNACPPGGVVARLGSDEFAILLDGAGSVEDLQRHVEQMHTAIAEPFDIADKRLRLTASMGATVHPWDGQTPEDLMTNADLALNRARRDGGRRIRFYANGMNEAFQTRTLLARDLQSAVRKGELEVYFQSVVRTADRAIVGFEAVARWNHPAYGHISPATFVPLAEEIGLIGEIGGLILRKACHQTADWNNRLDLHLFIAVNISQQQLGSAGLDKEVAAILEETGLPATCLELEVTESALMDNIDLAAATLGRLRDLGVSIAIDDFGTGYSNLVALRRLPVSRLKIDRSFIDGYGTDPENTVIVDSIIHLAKSLEMSLTAEGVEQLDQLERLKEQGCENVQGFYFGYPVPAAKAEETVLHKPTAPKTAGGQG